MNKDDMSDDAEFDAFLKREDGLSRRLQGLQGAPDAALDAAILQRARDLMAQEAARPAAANDAGESTPAPRLASLSWRWRVPAGIAATVLAGVFARQAYQASMNYEPGAAMAPLEERALILERPKIDAPAAPAVEAPPALQVPAPAPARESKRVLRDAPPPPPSPPATDKSAAMDAYRPALPPPQASEDVQTVVVTGQRAAMRSAAKLKQNAEEVIDGVVAEEAGKLPDKSTTEVLQRMVGIALKKWVPNAPYVARLRAATPAQVYQVYLDQKPDYANSSAFYLDAADILLDKGQRDLALRVLSNLAEMDLENRAVLRILGYRLLQAGAPRLAVPVFEEVLRIAVEEPQSFRDLGLALAAAGRPQEAIDKLYEVALRPWAARFPDIETIALADMNALIATSGKRLDVSAIDKRLRADLPLDLRVVLTWDADNTDIDLHVTDPDGEQCFFAHNRTALGGMMSRDFTGGYGPEEFALRRAKPGKYKIEAKFYGNRQQILAGATTLQVKLFSGFGSAAQKEKLITLRLKDAGERVFVGDFEVQP